MVARSITDLHTVVKNLYTLSNFTGNGHDYEALLKLTVALLLGLLNYNSLVPLEVNLSTTQSDIDEFRILCYLQSDQYQQNILHHITGDNILHHVASYDPSHNEVLDQLVLLLSNNSWDENRQPKLKQGYAKIISNLSQLLQFFIEFHNNSLSKLQLFLTKCLAYESRFYTNLQNKLEVEMNLNDQDTQQLVEYLDSIVHNDDLADFAHDDDTMFTYTEVERPQNIPLGFQSNNNDFKLIYNLFLQIISRNNITSDLEKYVRIMINVFKKHANIDYFEINKFQYKEMKLKKIVDFFIGDNPILPHRFVSINEKVLSDSDLLSEMRPRAYDTQNVSAKDQPFVDNTFLKSDSNIVPQDEDVYDPIQPCSKEDQIKLFHTLNHIIPILNEVDLNFDSKFPYLLRYYLRLLYDILPSASSGDDYLFVNEIIKTVNLIVDIENEEDNVDYDIKEVVSDFYELHLKLADSSNLASSVLMRYANFQFYRDLKLAQKFIDKWQKRSQHILSLRVSLHKYHVKKELSEKKKFLEIWFNQQQRIYNVELETSNYYNTCIQYKFLISKWNTRLWKIREIDAKAPYIFTTRYWNIWRKQFATNRKHESQSIEYYANTVKRKEFNKFVDKFRDTLTLETISKDFIERNSNAQDTIIKNYYWNKWLYTMNVNNTLVSYDDSVLNLSDKLANLSTLENKFIKQKYLKQWKRSSDISKLLNRFQKASNLQLVSYTLNDLWIKKFNLLLISNRNILQKKLTLRKRVFETWIEQFEHRNVAKYFYRKNLLKNILKIWNLKISELKFKQIVPSVVPNDHSILQSYWRKAYLLHLSTNFLKISDFNSTSKMLQIWSQRNRVLLETGTKAVADYESKISSKQLKQWVNKTNYVNEMVQISDLNLQRKYFNNLLRLFHLYNHQLKSVSDKLLLASNFNDKFSKQVAFRVWKDGYYAKFENAANSKIEKFHANYVLKNRLSLTFRNWVRVYNKRQSDKRHLDDKCNDYITSSLTLKFMFQLWRRRMESAQNNLKEAINFENDVLAKKFLIIWYDQCFNKLSQLNEKTDLYVARKEIRKLEEIVNIWSMKIINRMKRNQETCDLFIDRWQNLKLKAIFGLWVIRCKERQASMDEYDISDISHMSNSSPLAHRVQRQRNAGANGNYLTTPIKEQVTHSVILTPRTAQSSPTKLEETTQRLRYERTDALRKYLSRAKGLTTSTPERKVTTSQSRHIPPPKLQALTDGHIKLSPPKINSYSNILPPNPPNFDLGREHLTLSSEDNLVKPENLDSDIVVIDSAKRLRRITPIIFPTEEELNLPKFSPVGRLKERLRNNLQSGSLPSGNSGIFS